MAQESSTERRVWLAVRVFERLGLCALTLILVWLLWLRHTSLVEFVRHHHGRVVQGQEHVDALMAPQTVLLRTICRGMARSLEWPEAIARDCDVAVPGPMGPDRAPTMPDVILGESRQSIGG